MNMTEDYLAISNTGKNITLSMSPGMKRRILGDGDRVILCFARGTNSVEISACAPSVGYKIRRRRTVWSMTMAAKWRRHWPVHDRIVFRASQVQFNGIGAVITLPQPKGLQTASLNANETESLYREIIGRPDHLDPTGADPEPNSGQETSQTFYAYIDIDGDYFGIRVPRGDHTRFWDAYLRYADKREAAILREGRFTTPDMITMAVGGGCIGFTIALLIALAGWLQ